MYELRSVLFEEMLFKCLMLVVTEFLKRQIHLWGEKAWKTRDLSFSDVFNHSIRRHHIWQNKYMMKSKLKRSFTSRCDIKTNVEAITTARSSCCWWEITRLRDLYDFSQVWIHSFHNANLSFFLINLILISTSPSHPLSSPSPHTSPATSPFSFIPPNMCLPLVFLLPFFPSRPSPLSFGHFF